MDFGKIDNIIFDLGGVLIDIDYQLTIDAFRVLGVSDLALNYSQAMQTSVFDRYETGEISTQQFINKLKEHFPDEVTPNQLVHAWNKMILDFPRKKLSLLESLSHQKRIYLLSNTNDIHLQKVNRKLELCTDKKLDTFFIKSYYSHLIRMRKPHANTFQFVCDDAGLIPENTLFIDDSIQHIEGAKLIGLHTHFYTNADDLYNLLNGYSERS